MQQENLSCQTIEAFLEKLSTTPSAEERISLSLSFMSHSLFRDKVPYFKGFWQAKEKAFENLKETPTASPLLWAQYKELCEEFHRVKIVIDEQAAFAAEQIELALLSFAPLVEKILLGDEIAPYSLKHFPGTQNRAPLEKAQGCFWAIHSLIEQLAALRQEVLRSTMKIRLKTRLTADINVLIEKILPLRKEYKNQVAQLFLEIVENFKKSFFDPKTGALASNRVPIIQLQKEVKILQSMAKELSLTGDGFKKSRSLLSPCWNTLKAAHEHYKKKQGEQKAAEEQRQKELHSRLDEFRAAVASAEIHQNNKEDKKRLFLQSLKSMDLPRDEMTAAIEEVKAALEPLYAAEDAKREESLSSQKNAAHARAEKVLKLRTLIELQPSATELDEAFQLFSSLKLSLLERLEIEPQLLSLRDCASRLEATDPQESLLTEKERRLQIRERLEELKKIGTTFGGADFHQALLYNQAIQRQKERLALTEQAIQALEEQLEALS